MILTKKEMIDAERAQHKKRIKLMEHVRKLRENKDFIEVFEKEIFLNMCAQKAKVSGSVTLSEDERADALSKAQAAGHIEETLYAIEQLGMMAQQSLEALDDEEAAILAESQVN